MKQKKSRKNKSYVKVIYGMDIKTYGTFSFSDITDKFGKVFFFLLF